MKLVEFCLKNPVTVTVGIILALLFGGIALFRIPLQMTPTVDRPEITVETIYPGASPREVEEEIVDRQEEQLNAVENLREMTSTSFDGRASVVLKFDWGTNKDIARLDVSEKLNLVKEIPEDAEEPVIRAVNSDEARPVAWIIMRTSRNINEVRPEAEDVIKPHLERVKGVGSVWMFGGQEREVRVALDHRALAARGISIRQVRDALIRENRNIKGGKIDEGKRRHVVRTVGQFPTLREMESTIVAQEDGRPVYLRDVARVSFDYKDLEFFVRQGGLPTIGFGVLRKTGANVVEVMRGVKSKLDYLNNKLYRGKDIYLELVYDETVYIKESVNQVVKNLLFGVGLAFLVLIFFLRSPRSALIISFAMPISIVTTFIFLDFLGRSLNIISLAGLAFAVGMVVDNSVVVLENIFRHREMGKPPFRAALDAAGEVWGAVLAASLTTMAVFVPIIFVKEEAGQLFRDIAITIAVAIFISLIVALTVLPMLSARFLRVRAKKGEARRRVGPLDILLFTWVGWLISWLILGANGWLARGVARRLAVTFLIVGPSVWLAFRYAPPMDYLPAGNRNLVFCL
ncbi:MAG: efflux RND transporter permease subunit, partial [Nitrospinota bacterium]